MRFAKALRHIKKCRLLSKSVLRKDVVSIAKKEKLFFSLYFPKTICTDKLWAYRTNLVLAIIHSKDAQLDGLLRNWQQENEYENRWPIDPNKTFVPNITSTLKEASKTLVSNMTVQLKSRSGKVRFVPLIYKNNSPSQLFLVHPREAFFVYYESKLSDDNLTCPVIQYNGYGIAYFIAVPSSRNVRIVDRSRPVSAPFDHDVSVGQLFYKGIVLAEITTKFQFASLSDGEAKPQSTKVHNIIFASYARKDLSIVESVASILISIRIGELRWDLHVLQAGDNWSDKIYKEIDKADSFQLFWSKNAKRSKNVRNEWIYALGLKREHFIKPVFWEEPMAPPPPKLKHLHFAKILL